MKLDIDFIRHFSRDDLIMLLHIEKLMGTYDEVPTNILSKQLPARVYPVVIKRLAKWKLIAHIGLPVDAYRLNYHGTDSLSLYTLKNQNFVVSVGQKMGCGKESDLYFCRTGEKTSPPDQAAILKLHRLGRTSFRDVKTVRSYHCNQKENLNWLKLSSISANTEMNYLRRLAQYRFRVPKPFATNRAAVVMGEIEGWTLSKMRTKDLAKPEVVLAECFDIICRLADHGMIHGDFNEFNLMIVNRKERQGEDGNGYILTQEDEAPGEEYHDERVVMIDFPQMEVVTHPNARELFNRDVQGIRRFFESRFGVEAEDYPTFDEVVEPVIRRIEEGEQAKRDRHRVPEAETSEARSASS